jgi:uncharacterized repeat protein (TIGR03803 family)
MRSPRRVRNLIPGIYSTVERRGCQLRSQLKESPSKKAQHRGRFSGVCTKAITGALLSVLLLVPAILMAQAAPSSHFHVLHTFHGKDGAFLTSTPIMDTTGNIYGTATGGGDFNCGVSIGCGTVFELNATGKLKVLHRFTGTPDGANPYLFQALARDTQGNLYGTTVQGGTSGCCGTVFKVNTTGKETVLYSFTGGADGAAPYSGLVADKSGNLYGTTTSGGFNYGTFFKVDKNGKETVLYTFKGVDSGDGSLPVGNLIEDEAGKLNKAGKEVMVYSFNAFKLHDLIPARGGAG